MAGFLPYRSFSILMSGLCSLLPACNPSTKKLDANIGGDTLLVALDASFDLGFNPTFDAYLKECLLTSLPGQKTPNASQMRVRFRSSELSNVEKPCVLEIKRTATSSLVSKPFTISKGQDGMIYGQASLAPEEGGSDTVPSIDGQLNTTITFNIDATSKIKTGDIITIGSEIRCLQDGKSANFSIIEAKADFFKARGSVATPDKNVVCKEVSLSMQRPNEVTSENEPLTATATVKEEISLSGSAPAIVGVGNIFIAAQETKKVDVKVEFGSCKQGEVFDLNERKCIEKKQ